MSGIRKTQIVVVVAALLMSGSLAMAGNKNKHASADSSLAGPNVTTGSTTQPSNLGKGEKGPHFGEEIQGMLAGLNLTDDQKGKIQTFIDDFKTKMKAFHEAHGTEVQKLKSDIAAARGTGDKTQMKALMSQMKTLMADAPKPKDLVANIDTVLTPDQKTAFDAKFEAKKEEFGKKHPLLDKALKNNNGSTTTAPSENAGSKLNI